MTRRPLPWFPILMIVVGTLLLLGNLRIIHDLGELFRDWWPLLLVLLGVWFLLEERRAPQIETEERLSIDRGEAEHADIHLEFGAGALRLGPAPTGKLLEGTFRGGVRHQTLPGGRLTLEPDHSQWWRFHEWRATRWEVGVTTEVPLVLRLDSGAAECELDLTETRLTDLDIQTGASQTTVRMPRSAGAVRARIESGAASVTVHIPDGVAARITCEMGLGSKNIDVARFPRMGGVWESPEYAANPNRVDLRLEGGVGSIRVV